MTATARYFRPDSVAEAAEFDFFIRLEPRLRATHGGQYVAVCGGEVIASGVFLDAVDRTAHERAGGRAVYCGWVEPPEGFVAFSGLFEVSEETA